MKCSSHADHRWCSTVATFGKTRHRIDAIRLTDDVLDLTWQRFLRNDYHEITRRKKNLRLARGTAGKQIDSATTQWPCASPFHLLSVIDVWRSRPIPSKMICSTEPISQTLAFCFRQSHFNYCWHARWLVLSSALRVRWPDNLISNVFLYLCPPPQISLRLSSCLNRRWRVSRRQAAF